MVGVPLGRHIFSRGTVCSDPIHWFSRARLIGNPSRARARQARARQIDAGVPDVPRAWRPSATRPVVLGDLKPDYAELVAAMGGHVVTLGRGHGTLNPLDPGAAAAAPPSA